MEQINLFFANNVWAVIPITIWVSFWKGYALWIAVKNNHKKWFVAIIILNTFGILEIIYIFWIAKKSLGDVKRVILKILRQEKK